MERCKQAVVVFDFPKDYGLKQDKLDIARAHLQSIGIGDIAESSVLNGKFEFVTLKVLVPNNIQTTNPRLDSRFVRPVENGGLGAASFFLEDKLDNLES